MLELVKSELISQALSPILMAALTAFAGWISYLASQVAANLKDKFNIDIEQKIQEIEAAHKQNLIDAAHREILAALHGGDTDPQTIRQRVEGYWEKTTREAVEVLRPTQEFAERVVNEGLKDITDNLLDRVKDRLD